MHKLAVFSLVVAWCLFGALKAAADSQPLEHFGVSLPVPKTLPQTVQANSAMYTRSQQLVPLELTINADGRVGEVKTPVDSLTRFAAYMKLYFENVEFAPGSVDGVRSVMQLPLEAVFRHGVRMPKLQFPVDSLGQVQDRDLYFAAIAANSVTLPEVVRFPSIFFDKQRFDTANATYPFALLYVHLDEQGRPTERKIVRSTVDTFAEQLRSALLYADYQPAIVRGTAQPSSLFVLVSFLPHQNFPTAVWEREMPDTVSLYHRLLVRSFADTLGIMSGAMIRHYPPEWYALSGPHTLQRGWLGASVGVDTSGGARFNAPGQWPREILSAISRLSVKFRMFAAMDYAGRPVVYDGEAMLGFVGSGLIRTRFLWLR